MSNILPTKKIDIPKAIFFWQMSKYKKKKKKKEMHVANREVESYVERPANIRDDYCTNIMTDLKLKPTKTNPKITN